MTLCTHCDEIVLVGYFNVEDTAESRPFCCSGCQTVYNTIHEIGLDSYYKIKSDSAIYKRRSPVETQKTHFSFIDDSVFLNEFCHRDTSGNQIMEFYLEGIHCLACLWLIEKLPEFLPGVVTSKLDLERSVATVTISEVAKFSEVAREFSRLGYRPHPLKNNQQSADLKKSEERASLLRIGVAGAAAGNIMLYAVSLYAGATDKFAEIFNLLTIIFAFPVLTYSAYPFYSNAWSAIKNKTISIDIPISIALILGAFMGIYNLSQGVQENYFDSLSTLVFLLLLSRYFLQKIQERGLSAKDLHFFYFSSATLKESGPGTQNFIEVHPQYLSVNDVIKVREGEFIPVDGEIITGRSKVNLSLLTGESLPVKVQEGDKVYSGTQNLEQDIIVRVQEVQSSTRLGQILKDVENGWSHRSKIVDITSRVSKYFTLSVCLLATGLFIYRFIFDNPVVAFEQALTLLIVTCPCALALATPLTFTRSLSKASKLGIIIKNDEIIERISEAENVFIDKTGTLTHGKLSVSGFEVHRASKVRVSDVILSLESKSSHPVALALLDFIKIEKPVSLLVEDYLEKLGTGVSGTIEGSFYEIRSNSVFEDKELIASFNILDTVRADSKLSVEKLKSEHYRVQILSGDNTKTVESIAREVGISGENAFSAYSPEMKSEHVKKFNKTVMIGDGANDAIGLSVADVGVAVLGAMDISLRASDVYLTTPGLAPVVDLMVLSKETMKVVRRNLILSLSYNFVSVVAVFLGLISPLIAAIIMPLSSLTVLVSTITGTKKLRALWK